MVNNANVNQKKIICDTDACKGDFMVNLVNSYPKLTEINLEVWKKMLIFVLGNQLNKKIMKKSINKISVNNHISMWQSMTERNRHSECAMDIAKYFGYRELWGAFKAIYNIHNQEGSLPCGVGRARYELVGYMLCKIEEDYGAEMREKISMCL